MAVDRDAADTSVQERPPIWDHDKDRIEFYSKKLELLWGRYLTVIHLLITLSGGTVLVFLNSLSLYGSGDRSSIGWVVFIMSLAAVSVLSTVLWRFTAQFFMEREVFGSAAETEKYFANVADHGVTATFREHRQGKVKLYRFVYRAAPVVALIALVLSWVLVLIFVTKKGEPSPAGSKPAAAGVIR